MAIEFLAPRRIKKKKAEKKSRRPRGGSERGLDDSACYVLITCKKPTKDGKMAVEMTYEGDKVLAAYLLENAQAIIDDKLQAYASLD